MTEKRSVAFQAKADAKITEDELDQVEQSLKQARNGNGKIIVSEHAILRYLERVRGINMDEVKRSILPDGVKHMIKTLGDGVFPSGAGAHSVRVKGNVVVTVLTKEGQK